jgi:hypothetical protein
MFRRGNHFYRRAYYIAPGGGIFFYDEPIQDGDPSLGAIAADTLPTCPVDADDCQGFNDPAQPALRTFAGAGFVGDWGSPDCHPMSKHKTFSFNEAGQFLTMNTEEGDPGDPFPALQVKDNGNSIVVTNDAGGKLIFSTFVKNTVGMVLMDIRYSDGSVSIEGAHILQRRFGGWRDEDLHFVRCSP